MSRKSRIKKNRKSVLRLFGWGGAAGLTALAILFVYCYSLFGELEVLMRKNPEDQRIQPSVIYSDVFILHKGDIADDSFLTERLKELRINFESTADRITWKSRDFAYPESILPANSPFRAAANQVVTVSIKDGRFDQFSIDGKESEGIAVEPIPVAQLTGSSRTIQDYIDWENIPSQISLAITAIEDQRFMEHHGFDPRSLARALWADFRSRAMSQGGSTITQQLVKNLLGSHQKTLFRKVRELVLAILMDARYEKEKILEKYLNVLYFGQIGALEVHGVSEAAKYFYNKSLNQLSLAEIALIAGVIRGPTVYSPYTHLQLALERKNTVLKKMAELGYITNAELKSALAEKLVFARPSLVNNKAPYFVDFVKSQVLDQLSDRVSNDDLSGQGLKIFTTIDLFLQRRADIAVSTTVREIEAKYKIQRPLRLEGILVAAEPKTGFVRALVGGRSYAETTFNRVLNMKRQVGSTFKPIAYLSALRKGTDDKGAPYTGAYLIDDEPWVYHWQNGKRSWTPHNYEKGYRGRITLREAFANSINIPMAKIGVDVGPERVIDTAHKLGVVSPLAAVPSLVLGSVDLEPLELLQVYSTFANRGTRVELTTVRSVVDRNGAPIAHYESQSSEEFDPKLIDIINDLLQSVVKEGTAKTMPLYGYTKPARGKTGTTSFSRDAWFAGFSQGLVAVTWTGFDELKTPDVDDDEGARKFKSPALLTGAGAALPTWARFFAAAKPSKREDTDMQPDSSLERINIDRATGLRAKRSCPSSNVYEELFLPNTAPSADCNIH